MSDAKQYRYTGLWKTSADCLRQSFYLVGTYQATKRSPTPTSTPAKSTLSSLLCRWTKKDWTLIVIGTIPVQVHGSEHDGHFLCLIAFNMTLVNEFRLVCGILTDSEASWRSDGSWRLLVWPTDWHWNRKLSFIHCLLNDTCYLSQSLCIIVKRIN